MSVTKEWFGEWFNSPYYHILYQHRDHEEARFFINNLVRYFGFVPTHRLQDLACGKGRHSIYLNQLGFEVTGLDLSEQNIRHARQHANERLHFAVHDMRKVYQEEAFDFILNLFTSFGYFAADSDNQLAVCSAAKGLKPEGKMLIDFLNPYHVLNTLVPEEVRQIEGIEFHITRHIDENNFIVKDIRFNDEGEQHHFQERVKAITHQKFLQYFKVAGLELEETFGNYALQPYVEDVSDRMIFVLHNKPGQSQC